MLINFYKYQGTGNDFVIIDNRDLHFDSKNEKLVAQLCDRRFGVGGDGLMLLEPHGNYDFTMRYYNSDGRESSMCGNGGRCIVAFAVKMGAIKDSANITFDAPDGLHEASWKDGIVSLKMSDVHNIQKFDDGFFLNTGSPHFVKLIETSEKLDKMDVYQEGKTLRHDARFQPGGTNVNFLAIDNKEQIAVRTFERGVEDETFSCGTGVVASSICASTLLDGQNRFDIKIKGGKLQVSFEKKNEKIENIWLIGAAEFVFEGNIEL